MVAGQGSGGGRRRRRRRRCRRGGRVRGAHLGGDCCGPRRIVVEDWYAHHPLGGVRHVGRLQFGGELSLPLVASVLEPDLHLRLGESQRDGEAGALAARQVALHLERRLQLEHLAAREHRPRLLLPVPGRAAARRLRPAPCLVLAEAAAFVGTHRHVDVRVVRHLLVDVFVRLRLAPAAAAGRGGGGGGCALTGTAGRFQQS